MFEAKIELTEPMTVAFLSMTGPYDQIPTGYATLYGWLEQRGLEPEGMPRAVYLSPPEVPTPHAAWELWAPVAGMPADTPANEQGLGIKQIESHTVASTMHRGPYENVGPAYESLIEWIAERGYAPAGPPQEVYYSDPDEVAPEDYLTQIVMPVALML